MDNFLLQAIDPALGCSTLEALIRNPDITVLRQMLGLRDSEDLNLSECYVLDPQKAREIVDRFQVPFDPIGPETCLSQLFPETEHDPNVDAPYLIHTGIELFLMLGGEKPLAFHGTSYPIEEGEDETEALFEPHVQAGRLVKRVVVQLFPKPVRRYDGKMDEGIRRLYYALPNEVWRIDAHELLLKQERLVAWSELSVRLEGALLGYTDAQNEWWVKHLLYRGTYLGGLIVVYMVVNELDLNWIRHAGFRAFPWENRSASVKLELTWPRPASTEIQSWMEGTDTVAVIRFGVLRRFFDGRAATFEGGAKTYQIRSEDVPLLNECLVRPIEVIGQREVSPV